VEAFPGTMDRTRYTDDVLDARMKAIDENFERLFTESRELRQEMRAGFADLRGEIAGIRTDLGRFQHLVMWLIGALAVSLVSLLGTAVLQL
jgi:hypothetical protein